MNFIIQKSYRHTIQDGRVITFAESFEEIEGVFGTRYQAVGCFEISASRNKVIVHNATIRTQHQSNLFVAAFILAWNTYNNLAASKGAPIDDWHKNPEKLEVSNILEANPTLNFVNTKNLRSNQLCIE